MRCVIPVDLTAFPPGNHSQVLAGPDTGFPACHVMCSRNTPGAPSEAQRALRSDRLFFVVSGILSLQLRQQYLTVEAGTLVRVPKGVSHRSWNAANSDAIYVEIIAPALPWDELPGPESADAAVDLEQLVQRDEPRDATRSKSGFDYKFLANRLLGSDHVALNVARVQPGHQGPDYHIHTFDQFYFVLRGRLSVDVGFERLEAGPLSLVALPAGIVHRQRNEGNEVEEHLAILTPEPPSNGRLDYQITMPRLTPSATFNS